MLTANSFFDIASFAHQELFTGASHVWDALKQLKPYMEDYSYPALPLPLYSGAPLAKPVAIIDNAVHEKDITIEFGDATKGKLKVYKNGKLMEGASVIMAGAVLIGEKIRLGKGVLIESGALIKSPAIIDDFTEVRQGAYMRGYCIAGKRCVVGHVTEVKHSIFLDDAKAGHFAYLGDSILGNHTNLGAGTKLANLRFIAGNVRVKTTEGDIPTGLRKLGAILGDHVQTGCNSVTSPGTLLGKKSIVFPNTTVPSGYHEKGSVIRA